MKNNFENKLIEHFKWFHSHPELSYEEYETTKKIKEILTEANIEIIDLPLETGLVAQIKGKNHGPVVTLRCDIDALPVNEETTLDYKSIYCGKMHACGHDFHIASILGAALLLKEYENDLNGTVKILFQPAEESSLGALKVVECGILNDVDVIFGLHAAPDLPVGTAGIKEGSVTAAVDKFEIEIEGVGCHAAKPHEGVDPIVVAAQLISSVQSIVSRNIDPFTQGIVSITHVTSGNTWNVIPTSAFLEGTVRSLNKVTRVFIKERLEELTTNIAKAFRATASLKWIAGPPATNNDSEWVKFAEIVAMDNNLNVDLPSQSLGGEDFAFYQENIKGVFIWFGTGESYPIHHPKFQVDPNGLKDASIYFADLAIKALIKLGSDNQKGI